MMKVKMKFIICIIFFISIFSASADIIVFLNNDSLINGEVLYTTDSSFYLEKINNIDYVLPDNNFEENFEINKSNIIEIKYKYIKKIIIKGTSYKNLGAFIGGSVGIPASFCILPLLISMVPGIGHLFLSPYAIPLFFSYLALGTAIFSVTGATIGSNLSADDIIIEHSPDMNLKLKPYAKYQNEEPEFLKKPGGKK